MLPRLELRHAGSFRGVRGSSDGSSSSSTATTTTNVDKRMTLANGVGVSSDSSTVTVNSLDAGIVSKALDTVASSDATAGHGFDQLLTLADHLFTGGFKALGDSQAMTNQAYQQATTEKSGTIDNKTIMVLGVAAASAFALSKMKG